MAVLNTLLIAATVDVRWNCRPPTAGKARVPAIAHVTSNAPATWNDGSEINPSISAMFIGGSVPASARKMRDESRLRKGQEERL